MASLACLSALLSCVLAAVSAGAIYGAYGVGPHIFHGHYSGKCGNDGFYYADHSSFVICSNGNAYHQPCAPGTRNSGVDNYHHGNSYHYRDFCDVNLVDYGYGAHHHAGPYHNDYAHGYGGPYGHGYGGLYGHGYGGYAHNHIY